MIYSPEQRLFDIYYHSVLIHVQGGGKMFTTLDFNSVNEGGKKATSALKQKKQHTSILYLHCHYYPRQDDWTVATSHSWHLAV